VAKAAYQQQLGQTHDQLTRAQQGCNRRLKRYQAPGAHPDSLSLRSRSSEAATTTGNDAGTFLLGVGAQKAGTSWLHKQLNQRNDAHFGFLKEYHIHDALNVNAFANYGHGKRWNLGPRSLRRRWLMGDPARYYNYFQGLLRRPGIVLTGDITPSYAAVPASALCSIREQFDQRGIRACPVFLMRDPIERLISKQRMKCRKSGQRDATTEIESLRKLAYNRPRGATLRGDYAQTLNNLDEAFGLANCFIGFYETLFTADSFKALCATLGITYREPNWDEQVNRSRTTTTIPDNILGELGRWQAGSYAAVQQQFPDADLAAIWPTAHRWCLN
jgi:hypothetical protein